MTFGGIERTVKPLPISVLRRVLGDFDAFFEGMKDKDHGKALDAAEKIIPAALDISPDDFAAVGTDFVEIWTVVEAAAQVTGLRKLGEYLVTRAGGTDQPTGMISSPNS